MNTSGAQNLPAHDDSEDARVDTECNFLTSGVVESPRNPIVNALYAKVFEWVYMFDLLSLTD